MSEEKTKLEMENRRRQAESYFRKKLKIGDRVQYTIDGYRAFLRRKENRSISMDEWAELYNANPDAMDKAIAERKGTIVEDWKGTDSGWMGTDDDKIWQFGWVVRWDDEAEEDLVLFGYLRTAEEATEEVTEEAVEVNNKTKEHKMRYSDAKTRYQAQKENPDCWSFYKVEGGYACFYCGSALNQLLNQR